MLNFKLTDHHLYRKMLSAVVILLLVAQMSRSHEHYYVPLPKVGPGVEAISPHDFPFFALVTDDNHETLCAGTLVKENVVLTAAYCVHNLNVSTLSVSLGLHEGKHASQKIRVIGFVEHPCKREFGDHDVALLGLAHPARMSSKAGVIDKMENWKKDRMAHSFRSTCYVLGFANNNDGTYTFPGKPVKIPAPLTSDADCEKWFDEREHVHPQAFNSSLSACILKDDGIAPCPGMAGNPLVCDLRGKNVYTIVGVLSWGTCRNEEAAFARVAQYDHWIRRSANFYIHALNVNLLSVHSHTRFLEHHMDEKKRLCPDIDDE